MSRNYRSDSCPLKIWCFPSKQISGKYFFKGARSRNFRWFCLILLIVSSKRQIGRPRTKSLSFAKLWLYNKWEWFSSCGNESLIMYKLTYRGKLEKRWADVFQIYPKAIHFSPLQFCPSTSLLVFPVFCSSPSTVLNRYFDILVNSIAIWSVLKLPKIAWLSLFKEHQIFAGQLSGDSSSTETLYCLNWKMRVKNALVSVGCKVLSSKNNFQLSSNFFVYIVVSKLE